MVLSHRTAVPGNHPIGTMHSIFYTVTLHILVNADHPRDGPRSFLLQSSRARGRTAAPPPQVGGAQAMDPPAKLTSAQRALLHRIKEARAWYQGSDPFNGSNQYARLHKCLMKMGFKSVRRLCTPFKHNAMIVRWGVLMRALSGRYQNGHNFARWG